MKRIVPVLLAVAFSATWVGCQSATDPGTQAVTVDAASASSTSDYTLVTLKVPNMT